MVRWGLAAQATDDELELLEALVAARRCAELAFHQAVWGAVWARPKRHPWREIAPLTGMPWQTLYRRYRHRPERLPRVSVSMDAHGSVGNVPRRRTSQGAMPAPGSARRASKASSELSNGPR